MTIQSDVIPYSKPKFILKPGISWITSLEDALFRDYAGGTATNTVLQDSKGCHVGDETSGLHFYVIMQEAQPREWLFQAQRQCHDSGNRLITSGETGGKSPLYDHKP